MRLLLLLPALAGAETIDRIAITAGNHAITSSELELQMRMTAFLNGDPLDLGDAARRRASERLVEQALIRREMELSRYPRPEAFEAQPLLADLRKDPRFASEESYRAQLARYGVSEEELLRHLLLQLTTLRFIEYRFRSGVQVQDSDIREYYEEEFLPAWRERSAGQPPSFEESREQIESILEARAVNRALDRWLKQAREQTRIRFHREAVPEDKVQ